jgi:hypothetical protein
VLACEVGFVFLFFIGNRVRDLVEAPRFRLSARFFLNGDDVITLAAPLRWPLFDAAGLGLVESGWICKRVTVQVSNWQDVLGDTAACWLESDTLLPLEIKHYKRAAPVDPCHFIRQIVVHFCRQWPIWFHSSHSARINAIIAWECIYLLREAYCLLRNALC